MYDGELFLMVPAGVKILKVHAVEGHHSLHRVVESLNQANDGRLATSRVANESHHLVGLHLETCVGEHLDILLGWIVEVYFV